MSTKRSASGGGSIRQRSDGRWEARITIGTNPGTGRPIRRSIYGPTQGAVRKEMTAILREVDRGTYQVPDKTTVSEWMQEWLNTFCANSVKPLTFSAYQAAIRNHIAPAIGAMPLQTVRGVHIQRLYNDLTARGLSPKTVKNSSAILHRAFSVALKQGLIVANPIEGATLPKMKPHEIKPLTDEEIPLFLAEIESSPFRNAFALCLFAGLREGECLGLSWSQVDFDRHRITVSQQLQRIKHKGGGYCIRDTTKSGKPRVIEPPAIAFEYLQAERKQQIENRLKAGRSWNNPDDLVFTDMFGEHLAIPSFYSAFKRAAAAIGRPDARPHDLRHTCATVAIASGSDIKSVQDLLGHATASFTLNVYAHTSEKMMEDTAARVQNYYDSLNLRGQKSC